MRWQDLYSFAGQNDKEQVVAVVKRHPISLLILGYEILLWLLLPWVVFVFSPGFTAPFAATFLATMLIALWYSFIAYFMWINDIYLVTNRRVIACNQQSLFKRVVSEVPYDKVQSLSHEVTGLKQVVMHIGDVIISTASRDTVVRLRDVSDPYGIEQMIAKFVHV